MWLVSQGQVEAGQQGNLKLSEPAPFHPDGLRISIKDVSKGNTALKIILGVLSVE